jgi:Icc-related predicted phosphoesterase
MNGASRLFVIAGNDDPWYVDELLAGSPAVVFCDDRIVRVGGHEMLSSSYANPTPWNSPRELDEDALYDRLRALADQLEEPSRAIFNLHVPPYDSRLDSAPELRGDLTPRYAGGAPVIVPVGSRAVRRLIEEVQPLLALHGHIHESKGETLIGRTLAVNSGSEYNTGRLHGVVVSLGEDRVVSHQFVVG